MDTMSRPNRRRSAGRHDGSPAVGTDGLTDAERRAFLASFRQGIGSKPADTEQWRHRAEIMADKLADSGVRSDR